MDETNTRKALISSAKEFLTVVETMNTRFGLVEDLPIVEAGAIGWENKTFDPSNKPLWCSVFYRPNPPVTRTIGSCGYDEINGFMQIDFNIPPDDGESVMIEWEQKARLYFFHGRGLEFGGQIVLVTSSAMSQGRLVENNFRKSLTVAFKSQVRKNNQI